MSRIEATGPLRRDLELIQKTVERAAALTKQLLAFSRKQMLAPKVLDLNTVVSGMVAMLERLIGDDIELVFRAGSELGRVKVDPGQLEQVIAHLVVNARDAMPQGGRLTIETTSAELGEHYAQQHAGTQAGSYVMLAVSDTGIGMDRETQARIFEPFFTTKEVERGIAIRDEGALHVGLHGRCDGAAWDAGCRYPIRSGAFHCGRARSPDPAGAGPGAPQVESNHSRLA